MHAFAVGQRREMAENAVARRGASVALACRAFGVSETCYRYGPKLRAEKQAIVGHWFEHNGGEIVDLLVGLTDAKKTWGFWPVFFGICAMCRGMSGTTSASIHWPVGDCLQSQ